MKNTSTIGTKAITIGATAATETLAASMGACVSFGADRPEKGAKLSLKRDCA